MLNKIAFGTAFLSILITWVLRVTVGPVQDVLSRMDGSIMVLETQIGLGYALPGMLFAAFARAIKLHDRVSDILGLRRRFDVNEILVPLAEGAGVPVGDALKARLADKRSELMKPVFYQYVSSTASTPAVDRHLITMALDQWTYFWIIVETDVALLIAALVAFVCGVEPAGITAIGLVALSMLLLRMMWRTGARYAKREVEDILSNSTRKTHVRGLLIAI